MAFEPAEDAAATKWARKSGRCVRLVSPAFPQPLGLRPLKAVWSRHLRWARLRRATFPLLFAPEIFSISLVSFAAVWVAASLLQEPASVWLGLYVLAWYGADFTAARALGWPSTARSLMALPLRDLLLLSIWIGAWTGRSFTWHGNAMTANRQSEPQG
jgi:ceramide glucosyltransferase